MNPKLALLVVCLSWLAFILLRLGWYCVRHAVDRLLFRSGECDERFVAMPLCICFGGACLWAGAYLGSLILGALSAFLP